MGDIAAFASFIVNPSVGWSNAASGFGVLGLGSGGTWAARFVAGHPAVAGLALVNPPLPSVAAPLGGVFVPVLGTVAVGGDPESGDDLEVVRSAVEHAEWARYGGVEAGYWDADQDRYDAAAATDTFDRVVGFFGLSLPPKE